MSLLQVDDEYYRRMKQEKAKRKISRANRRSERANQGMQDSLQILHDE